MTHLTNFIALVARILLAYLFVQAGYSKLFGGVPATIATMNSHGLLISWSGARSSLSSSAA